MRSCMGQTGVGEIEEQREAFEEAPVGVGNVAEAVGETEWRLELSVEVEFDSVVEILVLTGEFVELEFDCGMLELEEDIEAAADIFADGDYGSFDKPFRFQLYSVHFHQ